MKKALFAMALGVLTITATHAQTENQASAPNQQVWRKGTPEERATRQTKMMVKSLGLTAEQETKLQALNFKRLNELTALHQNRTAEGPAHRNGLGKEGKTIRDNWNTELKAILTPEQYAKYEAQRGDMRERRSRPVPNSKR